MNIEEALSHLRLGKKIKHSHMPDDEYYAPCRVSIRPDFTKPIPFNEMPMSIVWMKGDKKHPDFIPSWNPYDPKTDPCKHGLNPMINLLWLISDEWEVLE